MISVPQWPSDIFGNDWGGLVNSSPAADRMSDEIFGANHFFWGGGQNYRCANQVLEKSIA